MNSWLERAAALSSATAVLAILSANGSLADKGYNFSPSDQHRIIPPYVDAGYAGRNSLVGLQTEFQCDYDRTDIRLFQKSVRVYRPDRTVQVNAPAYIDLTDPTIVNAIIVNGWRFAWRNCFANYAKNQVVYTDYSRVKVIVYRNNEVVVEAGPTVVASDGSISSASFINHELDRLATQNTAGASTDEKIDVSELPAPTPSTGSTTIASATAPTQDTSITSPETTSVSISETQKSPSASTAANKPAETTIEKTVNQGTLPETKQSFEKQVAQASPSSTSPQQLAVERKNLSLYFALGTALGLAALGALGGYLFSQSRARQNAPQFTYDQTSAAPGPTPDIQQTVHRKEKAQRVVQRETELDRQIAGARKELVAATAALEKKRIEPTIDTK